MSSQTPPRTSSIPIVDLEGTRHEQHRRAVIAAEIRRAARDTGFFYIANHGIPGEVIEQAFAAARLFFSLPAAQKADLQMVRGEARGYEPLNFQTLNERTASDLKESFQIGGAGPWPVNVAGFRDALLTYYAAACDLGAHLMRIIALSLELPEEAFEEAYQGATPSLRLLHYPPRPSDASPLQIGAGAHTDWGGITILAQDAVGGLEVQNADGEWLRATPIAGTFVVNLGDLIVRWTNDLYHSTPHRVFNPAAERDRYSMALFFSPNSHARIECLPTCVRPGEEPRYAACTAGEHIEERRRTTYGVA